MNNNDDPWERWRRPVFLSILLMITMVKSYGQFYAVKVDGVGLVTTTFHIEGSMVLTNRWSVHLPVVYNPWTFGNNKKFKQVSLLPGVRYWSGDSYAPGYFIGLNGIGRRYNAGGLFGSNHRRDGWAWGAGISGGYVIALHRRWNLEFEVGLGVVWSRYDKYKCIRCGDLVETNASRWFLSPNKASAGIVFLF